MLKEDPNICIEMYADDTVLYTANACPIQAMVINNESISKLHRWCISNKLTINFSKTKHMLIPRNDESIALTEGSRISIGENCLENVNMYHYLGVDLDRHLSFEKMVDATFNKANRKLYLLKKIRPYITNGVAAQVYKTHVLPMLDYADFITDSCIKSKVKNLDKIQKRAIHVIDNKSNHDLNYEQLLHVYNLQPLIRRREQHQLCMMYRLSTNDYYLERHSSGKELRSTRKIKFGMKCTRLTKIMNSPYYRAVRLWDQLPVEIQRATTKVKFKTAIG